MAEFMIMGLRLTAEGITAASFQSRFGRALSEVYGPQLSKLSGSGLIETGGARWTGVGVMDGGSAEGSEARIRLTKRGRLLGNRVFSEFVN